MLTTFDRYLLHRFVYTFGVLFLAMYGLYIVIDLFTNIDAFQHESGLAREAAFAAGREWSDAEGVRDLAFRIVRYYGFHASEFLELGGPVLIVSAAIAVLGLTEKHSESHPILAAGIPAFRLLRPLLLGAAGLNLLLMANQELVMPAIALQLQAPRGSTEPRVQQVEPVYDYGNFRTHIDGEELNVAEQKLIGASFSLPEELATEVCTLRAEHAVHVSAENRRPAGWLLVNMTVPLDDDILTEIGRTRIEALPNGRDVFFRSDVTFDQLYNRGRNLRLLSSVELVRRIRNPATGDIPVRTQSMALHERVTRPVLSLLSIVIALPLVMRRESRSLIGNMAICCLVLGSLYVITQASVMAGGIGLLRTDMAAWLPVVVTGTVSSWTAGCVQT